MDALDRNLAGRTERFVLRGDEQLTVTIEPTNRSVHVIHAQLLDISSGGAKLLVDAPIIVEATLALRIVSPRLASPLDVDASVCWIEQQSGDEHWLGVAFRPELPSAVLGEIVADPSANRRDNDRKSIAIATRGAWEMSPEKFDGIITDLCDGGFCMTTNYGSAPGARVMLLFDYEGKSARVTARMQWQVKARGQFVSGCQFITPNGHSILSKVAKLENNAAQPPMRDRPFPRN